MFEARGDDQDLTRRQNRFPVTGNHTHRAGQHTNVLLIGMGVAGYVRIGGELKARERTLLTPVNLAYGTRRKFFARCFAALYGIHRLTSLAGL